MNTPRTDKAATTIKDYAGYDEVVPADVCRDIERELAELQLKFMDQSSEVLELRKDKERLDWLLKNCLIKELDLEWVHESRETIDEAMNYESTT